MKANARFPILLLLCLAAPVTLHAGQIMAAGITEPIADVTLSASVPGIVSAWKFKEGDFVKQGDVILELDKRLEELETERRKLAMDKNKKDWEALQTLFQKNSISVRKEELEKAEADYKIAATEYEMATEQLRKRSVAAPTAGYLAEIARDVGEACQPYQPLIRIVDTRQGYFVSNVEARVAGRLKLDQTANLEIATGQTVLKVSGKVVFISPVVDPASGLQKVRVLFDNADGSIRPGVAGKLLLD